MSNSTKNKATFLQKGIFPFSFLFFVLILLSACGGSTPAAPLSKLDSPVLGNGAETAVSTNIANTAQAVPSSLPPTPETAVSTHTPISTSLPVGVDETATSAPPESTPINIAPAATTAFEQAGLASGGGNFISLDDPEMIVAAAATWLQPDDVVMGVIQNGEARAYPIRQAAYHHIINDTIGGEPFLITY